MVKHLPFKERTTGSVPVGGTKKIIMEQYLRWRFYRYNHNKYKKYFDEWFKNVNENQLRYWRKEMVRNKDYSGA